MINGTILNICIGDIYLNFLFISKNLKYFFGPTLAVMTILISMRLISYRLGSNRSEQDGGIALNTHDTRDLVPVQSFHSLIPIANTGVSIAPHHEHNLREELFRIEIVDDSDEIYGPNGKQRILGSSTAEYIDTYV